MVWRETSPDALMHGASARTSLIIPSHGVKTTAPFSGLVLITAPSPAMKASINSALVWAKFGDAGLTFLNDAARTRASSETPYVLNMVSR